MWIFRGSRRSRFEQSKETAWGRSFPFPHIPPTAFHLLLLIYCLLPSAYGSAARGLYEVRELRPGIFLWIPEDVLDVDGDPRFSRTATSAFVITPEGVVVVNTTNSPFHAREVLYEIRRRTELPIRYVINTDAHGDIMMGNEVFVDQQAVIISTAAAQAEMRWYRANLAQQLREDENWRLQGRMRGIHPTPAAQAFDAEMTLGLGGQEIRVIRMSGGHSAGDAVAHVPAQKVLILGHLFENGFFPRMAASNVRRWIEILRDVESWDVEVYVPAHGLPGGKKEVAGFRQFLEWLVNEVYARIQVGKPLNEVRRELNLTETYRWSAREQAARAVEEVFQQLTRERFASPAEAAPAAGTAPASSPLPIPQR